MQQHSTSITESGNISIKKHYGKFVKEFLIQIDSEDENFELKIIKHAKGELVNIVPSSGNSINIK